MNEDIKQTKDVLDRYISWGFLLVSCIELYDANITISEDRINSGVFGAPPSNLNKYLGDNYANKVYWVVARQTDSTVIEIATCLSSRSNKLIAPGEQFFVDRYTYNGRFSIRWVVDSTGIFLGDLPVVGGQRAQNTQTTKYSLPKHTRSSEM